MTASYRSPGPPTAVRRSSVARKGALGVAALVLALLSPACDGGQPDEALAGAYRAEVLTVTFHSATGDFLAAGGTFTMDLDEHGRFAAAIDLPDVPEIEGDNAFAARFDGTYTRRGSEVLFFHGEDVFVRDLKWTATPGSIQTTDSLRSGARFDVRLRRL